jgi:CRP/FNR family cyclic AMP-dependent transcriptional regulator
MSEPVRSATRKEVLDSLRAIPLFCAVSESDLESIASHLIERRHPKNALIVEEGLPGDYMYVVREGRVKVIKGSEEGREKIMDFLEVGDFFGEMSLLDRAPRSASVKTMEPVLLLALSRTTFLDLLSRSPSLSLAVIQVLTQRLREADEQASSMSFQKVTARARGLFERIARTDDDGPPLTPPMTHQQIADMIGTSRETVTRAIKRLKTDGWLGQEGKRYAILAPDL